MKQPTQQKQASIPPELAAALGMTAIGTGAGLTSGTISGKDVGTTARDLIVGGLSGAAGGAGVGGGLALLGQALGGGPGGMLTRNPLALVAAMSGAGAGLGAFLKGSAKEDSREMKIGHLLRDSLKQAEYEGNPVTEATANMFGGSSLGAVIGALASGKGNRGRGGITGGSTVLGANAGSTAAQLLARSLGAEDPSAMALANLAGAGLGGYAGFRGGQALGNAIYGKRQDPSAPEEAVEAQPKQASLATAGSMVGSLGVPLISGGIGAALDKENRGRGAMAGIGTSTGALGGAGVAGGLGLLGNSLLGKAGLPGKLITGGAALLGGLGGGYIGNRAGNALGNAVFSGSNKKANFVEAAVETMARDPKEPLGKIQNFMQHPATNVLGSAGLGAGVGALLNREDPTRGAITGASTLGGGALAGEGVRALLGKNALGTKGKALQALGGALGWFGGYQGGKALGNVALGEKKAADGEYDLTRHLVTALPGTAGGVLGMIGGSEAGMRLHPKGRIPGMALGTLAGLTAGTFGGKALSDHLYGSEKKASTHTTKEAQGFPPQQQPDPQQALLQNQHAMARRQQLQGLAQVAMLKRQKDMQDQQELARREQLGSSLGSPIGGYMGKHLGKLVSNMAGERSAGGIRGFFGAKEKRIDPEQAQEIGQTLGALGGGHFGAAIARKLQRNPQADGFMDQLGL